MWASVLPFLYPVLSFLITDAVKGISERYGPNWHRGASMAFASTVGAALTQIINSPETAQVLDQGIQHYAAISPAMGALLGAGATMVHDLLTPPGTPAKPPDNPPAPPPTNP